MAADGDLRTWERWPDESEPAYAAFEHFRESGAKRSVAGSARARGTSRSLFTEWARRYHWRERAHAWDVDQARQDEAVVREERESSLRRTSSYLEQILQLTIARLLRLARRDPLTGDISFDSEFSPKVAADLLKIVHTLLNRPGSRPSGADVEDPARHLRALSSSELTQLIEFVRISTQEAEDAPTPTSPDRTE